MNIEELSISERSKMLANSEIMPEKLRIDASTFCQLNCKSCYMRLHDSGTMGKGYLSFENYKNLLDEAPYIKEVELSNSGEIFLNPDLIKIMEYSYNKGIRLTAFNGTNFNSVSDEQLISMVQYKFHGLTISIDGASQRVYELYRVNGDFNKVIENISRLNFYKKRYKSDYPYIRWQYIIMEHNELDIPKAKQLAQELGITIHFKLTWDSEYQPRHIELLRNETGLTYLTRNEYLQKKSKVYLGMIQCRQIFLSPQINWDGRLLGCCGPFRDDFKINVFEVGLENALKFPLFVNAKKSLLYDEPMSCECPCFKCEKRKQMLNNKEHFTIFD